MDIVPIKVKIGLRPNGHADHPNWGQLPMIQAGGLEKENMPSGWLYDSDCGHKEERTGAGQWDSPFGMQWGVVLVSEQFANEAVATFPDLVTILSEADLEFFYDNYHTVHLPDFGYNTEYMNGLLSEHEMKTILGQPTTDVEAKMTEALDENTPVGKVKRKNKKYTDFMANKGFKVKP